MRSKKGTRCWALSMFHESTPVASRCVTNLKFAPLRLKPQENKVFSSTDGECVSVGQLCSALELVAANNCLSDCYSLLEPRNTSPPGHQDQLIKGHSLCRLYEQATLSRVYWRAWGGAYRPVLMRQWESQSQGELSL